MSPSLPSGWRTVATWVAGLAGATALAGVGAPAAAQPAGSIKGSAWVLDAPTARKVIDAASVVIPARATGGALFAGRLDQAPERAAERVPVVVFLHGSSGLSDAIRSWQRWLAEDLAIASLAPDSMQLPDRITYTSPVDTATYEKIHALRLQEIDAAWERLKGLPWADPLRVVLAGTSEGGPAVARWAGAEVAGRILYSWSCENNYFVDAHRTAIPVGTPVLNVMSITDPFFSSTNPWVGGNAIQGHCGAALKSHRSARVILIAGAPHTLFNLGPVRQASRAFLEEAVARPRN